MNQALALLTQINAVLATSTPLVGPVTALGIALINWIHASGTDIKPFEEEIAQFESIIAGGQSVDDAWRAAHGLPPWKSA